MPWNWVETFAKNFIAFYTIFLWNVQVDLELVTLYASALSVAIPNSCCQFPFYSDEGVAFPMIGFTQKSASILVFQKCTPRPQSNFRALFSALKESFCPYPIFFTGGSSLSGSVSLAFYVLLLCSASSSSVVVLLFCWLYLGFCPQCAWALCSGPCGSIDLGGRHEWRLVVPWS